MKFECDSCQAQYMIADEKVGARGVKVKCKRCSHVIIVRPVSVAHEATAADAPLDPPDASDDADLSTEGPPVDSGANAVAEEAPSGLPPFESSPFSDDDDDEATIAQTPPSGGDTLVASRANGLSDLQSALETEGAFASTPAREDSDVDPEATLVGKPPPSDENHSDEYHSDEKHSDDDVANAAAVGPVPSEEDAPVGNHPPNPGVPLVAQAQPTAQYAAPDFLGGPSLDGDALDRLAADAAGELSLPEPLAPAPTSSPEAASAQEASLPTDALSEEISDAFSEMFDAVSGDGMDLVPAESGGRDPTKVLGVDQMQELRAQMAPSIDADAVGDLRSELSEEFRKDGLDLSPWEKDPSASLEAGERDEKEWHVAINDEDVGPLSLAEFQEKIASGLVERDSLAWKSGMADWLPAEDIPEILSLFEARSKSVAPTSLTAESPLGEESSHRLAAFDVGPPVDDLAGPPMGDSADPYANDPFGAPLNQSDPSWQPHGLTDIYQAANLAEAAVAPSPPPPPETTDEHAMGADADRSEEWAPNAASALSALVAGEIERIDDDQADTLLPADDALGLGLSSGEDLDAGPSLAEIPQAGPMVLGSGALSVAPSAAAPQRSTLLFAAIGGGVVVVVGLLVAVVALVAVLVTRDDEPKVMAHASAAEVPGIHASAQGGSASATGKAASNAAPTPSAATTGGVASTATTSGTANKVPPTQGGTKPVQVASATAQPKVAVKASPPAHTASRPRVKTHSKPKPPAVKRSPPPKPKVTTTRPTRTARNSKKGCDPVLDFDCDAKPSRSASSKKRKLTKTDILGVVRAKKRAILGCGKKNGVHGTIKMQWMISKTGRTSNVRVMTGKYAGKPVGRCLTKVIKRFKFPAFSGKPPPPIKFPFKL